MLTGRSKDMIRSGGENLYPAEVEAVLSDHPDVAAIALGGVPDAKYLEVGCAVVQPANSTIVAGDLEESLRSLAATKLSRYKCPRYYLFVDELPVNPAGKRLRSRPCKHPVRSC
jgi:fatty-acyl-CoA synthase